MHDLQIKRALISAYNKEGLDDICRKLHQLGVEIYSTGGTQAFIRQLQIPCQSIESLTGYPSILGGRVKTLHPAVFGGILARRSHPEDEQQIKDYHLTLFDLVIVDLYPFEETVAATQDEAAIIEKIDIGGVSLIRAAAKNFADVAVIASREEYNQLLQWLTDQQGILHYDQRKWLAARAFAHCTHYDLAITRYFEQFAPTNIFFAEAAPAHSLRYGENPHQSARFFGNLHEIFDQLHGKALSYNNLVDVDAACRLMAEFEETTFAIIKHTNACGAASANTVYDAWKAALQGDPESAFGGILISNAVIDEETAASIHEIFFEVCIAPDFTPPALEILKKKKNRILLKQKGKIQSTTAFKSVLNGVLQQDTDRLSFQSWNEVSRPLTSQEKTDLQFANLICKHLKSNAIALVKNKQLIGKGCGQTSRIDALRQAIKKARQSGFDLHGAVMASDAFFPFDDCVRLAHDAGITAVIHPGGSIRDEDSIRFCQEHQMGMVITGTRHFLH
ncbi:bifunctional phosphoribosylaminoimidazolecarboxamide formyltransferase/IMP cyclohydrolase [Thermoflavifilum thermophilum]|uniref:Bifunctional purine biosynthesis protein PurH n=1 Tax=Thermoflavifilum thermophilum TaxID=1393122 RepID=A0A1I7NAX2_9BACT|nr:bifunctional phosphoribosylaminoimidazolecarboxamide formyltransferase/IMP cyclohydrolase [Thermoflavifilum thermophilum]SFV31834.1 phosphoribosylaminoimidazolecarboxamide formyltransferase / IMP cyclohydrolase [Thermoflavifilum thermophilum]